MKNKKSFRIKRSVKFEELASKNLLLQNKLKKIIGGAEPPKSPLYGRLAGYYDPPTTPEL
jgi:hypothetical protein